MENEIAIIEKQVLQGDINPLDAFVQLKKLEELSKTIKKNIKELALEEIAKYSNEAKAGIDMYGANVSIKNSAGRWSYDHIQEIKDLENNLKELKKRHQEAYKADKRGESIVDSETGEIIQPAMYSQGDETIMIRFKK